MLMAHLAAAWLAALPLASADFYNKNSGVVNLDVNSFDDAVNGNVPVLVEFYAPWCGHCKQLKPAWIQAAKKLKGIVKVAAIDANDEKNRAIAGRYGIRGFPTIKIFKGGLPTDYNGGRDANSIINAGYAALSSYSTRVTSKNHDKFTQNTELPRALLFTKSGSTPVMWKALSTTFEGAIAFGEVKAKKEKSLVEKYQKEYPELKIPGIVVIPEGETAKGEVYSGSIKLSPIKSFFKRFAEIDDPDAWSLPELADESCMQAHCGSAALCAIIAMANDNSLKQNKQVIQQVEEGRDDSLFKFAWIDNAKQQKFLKSAFDITPQDYPQVVVVSMRKKRFAPIIGSFSADNIDRSLTRVLRGGIKTAPLVSKSFPKLEGNTKKCKAKPKPKPQQAPPKRDPPKQKKPSGGSKSTIGASVVLTSQNFKTLVLNSKAPWLVEFFAPWCGHCKQLAPHWKKAALKMRGMVKFGTVDATVEQQLAHQYGIQGYPTIKFFKEGLPKKPADYQSGRTTGAIAGFAKTLMTSRYVKKIKQDKANSWLDGAKDASSTPRALLLTDKGTIPDLWRAISTEFQGDVEFAVVNKAEGAFEGKQPPVIALRKGDTLSVYDGELNMPSIGAWVVKTAGVEVVTPESIQAAEKKKQQEREAARKKAEEARKVVHSIASQEEFDALCSKGSTVCAIAFLSPHATDDDATKAKTVMGVLAEKNAAKATSPFRYATIDARAGAALAAFREKFGVADDMAVAVVAMVPKRQRYQVMFGVFDEEHVSEFLTNLLKGRVKTASMKPFPQIGAGDDSSDSASKQTPNAKDEL
mmetsp:Transcript_20584/g.41517  ORF Transcript_20584/g.41517 Transcript_20584/m.41517 type:complete len:808 (-) Transcript_20584:65-2488(-)